MNITSVHIPVVAWSVEACSSVSVSAEAVSFVASEPVAVVLLRGSVVVRMAVVAVAADSEFVDQPAARH